MFTRVMPSVLCVALALTLGCPAELNNAGAAPTSHAAPASQPAEPRAPTYTVDLPLPAQLKPASKGDAEDVRERLTGTWISTTEGPNGVVISQTLSFIGDGAFTEVNAAGEQRRELKGTYTVVGGSPDAFTLQLKTATSLGGSKVVYSLRSDGTLLAQGGGREFIYQRVQVE
jgi:hypothetical protein